MMVAFSTINKRLNARQICSMNVNNSESARVEITNVFNAGFWRGANDRAAAGIKYDSESLKDVQVPQPPQAPSELSASLTAVWKSGYETGYQCGASDAELASVAVPGACGMLSGMGEGLLEMMGFFKDVDKPE
jgi:hypothetical protein